MTDFNAIGGHAAVRRLVDRFYDLMDSLPEAAAIRAMHDDDLTADRHKLTAFLTGWLGGTPLYWEQWDDARIARRHEHLHIDKAARLAWLLCMTRAMEHVIEDAALRDRLTRRFEQAARAVQNDPSLRIQNSGDRS